MAAEGACGRKGRASGPVDAAASILALFYVRAAIYKDWRLFCPSIFVQTLTVRRPRVCMQVETVLSPSAKWLTDITAFVQAPEGLENRAKLEVSTYGSIRQHP